MVFAKIGHGSCYHHWNEIFAGVIIQLEFLEDEKIHELKTAEFRQRIISQQTKPW